MARIKSTWNNHTTFWYNVIGRVIITFHIHVAFFDTSHAHAHIISSGWWTTIDFGYWKISHILSNLKLEWITKFELDIIRPYNVNGGIEWNWRECHWYQENYVCMTLNGMTRYFVKKKLLCVVFISETMSPRGRKIAEKKRHNSVSLSNSIRLREIDWKGI